MSEDTSVHIADILESIDKIRRYVGDLSYVEFIESEMLLDAVIRNLMIIGEAVRNLPDSIKGDYPDIEWGKIVGLRNILIHAYSKVDTEIVWSIITTKLDELERHLKA
jgi:uncharacterized protein with HEPN domain